MEVKLDVELVELMEPLCQMERLQTGGDSGVVVALEDILQQAVYVVEVAAGKLRVMLVYSSLLQAEAFFRL